MSANPLNWSSAPANRTLGPSDSGEDSFGFGADELDLNPAPIHAAWILEGNPIARSKLLSRTEDGSASTLFWDCTAGRFNWYYGYDESICVLEGSVILTDGTGATRRLGPGDTAFFPSGSRFEWRVERYVRKIAFCRCQLPLTVELTRLALRVVRAVMRRLGLGTGRAPAPARFVGLNPSAPESGL
jgi:uncharacterized cupin superfamily protein